MGLHTNLFEVLRLEETNRKLTEINLGLRRKVTELSFLQEVAANLMKSYDLTDLLESIILMSLKITRSEAACVLLSNPIQPQRLEIRFDSGGLLPTVKSHLTRDCSFLTKLISMPETIILMNGDADFLPIRQLDESLRSLIAVPLQVENTVIGMIVLMHRHAGADEHQTDYSNDDSQTISIFAQQAALVLENTRLKIEHARKDMYLRTITALTSAIDAKDVYTQNHSRRVADFSVALARDLQLAAEDVENIRYGATLHDIGKIGVEERILNKNGKLAMEEFKVIKAHPDIGAKILEPIDFLTKGIDIVRHHHERYDGKGYPEGLKGEAIPFGARIAGIADAWDAMTSHRSYRSALTYEEALAEIRRGAGSQFDPNLAKSFINLVEKDNILRTLEH
ncbi:MAG: HD domain-containing protein [Thermincola sp.]|nr:HD domain-containing protein [Thermincola sp.]